MPDDRLEEIKKIFWGNPWWIHLEDGKIPLDEIQGQINWLISEAEEAKRLRNKIIILKNKNAKLKDLAESL